MELRALLEALGEAERSRLRDVLGVEPDPASRLGPVERLARAWFRRPGHAGRLAPEAQRSLRLLLDAPSGLPPSALPDAHAELVEEGWLFLHDGRVHMPDALRLSLPPNAADAPHAARLLLPQLEREDARALALEHHGRPMQGVPSALLERPLRDLLDPQWVARSHAALEAEPRRLLDAALERAGELTSPLILELSREPTRIEVGGAAVVPRRSHAYLLARLGLLLPLPGGRWVVPEEVWQVLTSEARQAHATRLQQLSERGEDDEPLATRIRRPLHAGACAAALLATLEAQGALREGLGVARSALERCGRQVHVPPHAVPLLASVGRAAGLPFGELRLDEVSARLWHTWRVSGAWNEAHEEPDGFRGPRLAAGPVLRAAREAVLQALSCLPPGRFATREEIVLAATSSARLLGEPQGLVARLVDESLPALGMLEVGYSEGRVVMRLSGAARAYVAGGTMPVASVPATAPVAPGVLRVEPGAPLAALRALARIGRLWVDDVGMVCDVDSVELGLEASERGWEPLHRAVAPAVSCGLAELQAWAVTSHSLRWQPVQAALHVPDPALRERLLLDPAARGLWLEVEHSGACLLVRTDVPRARVQRLLRKHGVTLERA